MGFEHHPACMCHLCLPGKTIDTTIVRNGPGVKICVTGIAVFEKEIAIVFCDNGATCLEDQAVEAIREHLGLEPWQACEVKQLKCYIHKDDRRNP